MSIKTPSFPILNVLLAATLLSACSVLSQFRPSTNLNVCPPPPGIALSSNQVVRYYSCLGTLADEAINKEYQATNRSFSITGSDSDRLRLAMLLSLPDTGFRSIGTALDLLQHLPAGTTSAPSELQDIAGMLARLLAQQLRADGAVDDLTKALAAEKAHAEFLQGKIDAVKDLEINLIHRDQP
ncbi:hypothetical protein MIZ01_1351 [Sideroxyarcus emersonii]|uniref:Uncharacterized protein n=1 Tax=Sideroxyarcus emersonii TaxID=2764705 RepID=A0AAN1X9S9_9PROT|nr:hypothetical protein [Sideroxyarcus emersonii]BCK87567.1 hypothetical protein MIZ01_1351 [Sideroxyarcus emersonii]